MKKGIFILLWAVTLGAPRWGEAEDWCTRIEVSIKDAMEHHRNWQADMEEPSVGKASEVWKGVYKVFKGWYPNYVSKDPVTFLAPDLKDPYTNRPFPPFAITCPPAGRVYVTYALIENVFGQKHVFCQKKYAQDFFAFVVGHELGHRRRHFTEKGECISSPGLAREEEADETGALLTTIAGYRTRPIADKKMIRGLVRIIDPQLTHDATQREKMLARLLHEYDSYESVFEIASIAYFYRTWDLMDWLLEIVYPKFEEMVPQRKVPEVVMLEAAGGLEQYSELLALYGPSYGLKHSIYRLLGSLEWTIPTHTILKQRFHISIVMGTESAEEVQDVREKLKEYLKKMNTARPPFPMYAWYVVKGSLEYYLGDFDRANADFKDAIRIAPDEWKEKAKMNLVKSRLAGYLKENPRPKEKSLFKRWKGDLTRIVTKLMGKARGNRVVRYLLKGKEIDPGEKVPKRKCRGKYKSLVGEVPSDVSTKICPSGYKEIGRIPPYKKNQFMLEGVLLCQSRDTMLAVVAGISGGTREVWCIISRTLSRRVTISAEKCDMRGDVEYRGGTSSGYDVWLNRDNGEMYFVKKGDPGGRIVRVVRLQVQ